VVDGYTPFIRSVFHTSRVRATSRAICSFNASMRHQISCSPRTRAMNAESILIAAKSPSNRAGALDGALQQAKCGPHANIRHGWLGFAVKQRHATYTPSAAAMQGIDLNAGGKIAGRPRRSPPTTGLLRRTRDQNSAGTSIHIARLYQFAHGRVALTRSPPPAVPRRAQQSHVFLPICRSTRVCRARCPAKLRFKSITCVIARAAHALHKLVRRPGQLLIKRQHQ